MSADGATSVVHPRIGPRRGRAWATTWWAKAWVRAVEEAAYDQADLRRGRALARAGAVGGIALSTTDVQGEVGGEVRSAVEDRDDLWSVAVRVPALDAAAREALVEAVAAQAGRPAALLAGDLPHDLVEHAEEAGAELLPFGGELATTCTCAAWLDPCPHALAVLLQLGWLLEDDPLVLLALRGLPRDHLLAALHARAATQHPEPGPTEEDLVLETAVEAAERAARLLRDLGVAGPDES